MLEIISSTKGDAGRTFETAEDFCAWLEEMQPSGFSVNADGVELSDVDFDGGEDKDGCWDAKRCRRALRRALA